MNAPRPTNHVDPAPAPNPETFTRPGVAQQSRSGRAGGRTSGWYFTGLVALAALLPRLYVALAWTREPVWDGHYYHFGAKRIAEGLGYSEDVIINGALVWKPWCHYPVGYSAFLGGLYKVFGSGLWVAPVANAVLGALIVALVHRIAVSFLSTNRARFAAIACALHPGLILYTGVVMTELLAALSLVLVLFVALAFPNSKKGGVLTGICLGLGALVRPTTLLAGPLLLRVFRGGLRRALLITSIAAAATVLTIAPWTLRNCKVMDGCALISTNGGWNLAIGALTETGRFRTLTAEDGCPVVTGQVQQDRCWGDVGKEIIARDPGAWLALVPRKLAHTYNHESFAVGYLAEANPQLFPGEQREQVRATLTVFHHLLMAAAALSGIAWLWSWARVKNAFFALKDAARGLDAVKQGFRDACSQVDAGVPTQALLLLGTVGFIAYASLNPEHPFFWLIVVSPLLIWLPLPKGPAKSPAAFYLSGLVLTTTVTHALFFGEDRYHMTISPVLCLLAAAALRPPTKNTPPTESGSAADRQEAVS